MKVCNTAVDNQAHKCHSPPKAGAGRIVQSGGQRAFWAPDAFCQFGDLVFGFLKEKQLNLGGRSSGAESCMFSSKSQVKQRTKDDRRRTTDNEDDVISIQSNSIQMDSIQIDSILVKLNSIQ